MNLTELLAETRHTSFDNLGRLLTHEQITGGQTYATAYTYNLSGALLTETYPSGRVVTNNYNTDGELESVWGQKANQQTSKLYINQITLNSAGAVEKARLGNGTWETAAYNERLQITQIGLGHSATDKSLLKIDYDYGNNQQNNGSLLKQTVNFTGLTNQITQDYTYDALNRLKSAEEKASSVTSWKQTFNYDRFGNRTFDATNTTTMISSKATNPIIQSSDNRLKKDQDNDYVNDYDYDKNGNLTLDADNQRYVFDAENRIKEFFKSNNSTTNNPNAIYEYDGEGKRVKKFSDGVTTIFVYNAGGTLVAEYSTELNPEPQVSYLTSDHLGSPRIVTDGGGAVISRHDYMAFGDEVTEKLGNVGGRTTAQGYGKPDDVRKQYTGYERDKESGLDYAQARYYNSNHGRFTSVDPLTASASIRNPQTFNRYSYVLNSPYKFTDPLGLLPVTTGANGGRSWCSTCQTSDDDTGGYAESANATAAHEAIHAQQTTKALPPPQDHKILRENDPELQKIDEDLSAIFTDTGTVLGASSVTIRGTGFNHFKFEDDGQVHTIHIYGDETTTSTNAGVYIPKEFNDVKITSKDTVVARNPKTGEVILIAHVKVGSGSKGLKMLKENMKTVRENGTMYIGQIGGKGGGGEITGKVGNYPRREIHSHLVYFPSESSRLATYEFKVNLQKEYGRTADYLPEIRKDLGDFRKFVQ